MPDRKAAAERAYGRGEVLHSDCDCCEHAAVRIHDLRQALIGGSRLVVAERPLDAWALAVERLLVEHKI